MSFSKRIIGNILGDKYQKGQRIVFKKDFKGFPYALIRKGETGTIQTINGSEVYIKLDRTHDGLKEWNNLLQLGHDERRVEEYIK